MIQILDKRNSYMELQLENKQEIIDQLNKILDSKCLVLYVILIVL